MKFVSFEYASNVWKEGLPPVLQDGMFDKFFKMNTTGGVHTHTHTQRIIEPQHGPLGKRICSFGKSSISGETLLVFRSIDVSIASSAAF